MGFASGTVSFRRYAVVGKFPTSPNEELLAKIAENVLRPTEIGLPQDAEYGFSGGRHILDGTISFENNVYGDAVLFAMRVDTQDVPGDLKRAYQAIEEEAAAVGNPSGFASKRQKKDVKDAVQRKLEDEMREGRHRRTRLIPLLWDMQRQILYTPAAGKGFEMLAEIFQRTLGGDLQPLGSGSLALRQLDGQGKRRDYEDATPTRFASGPDGEGQLPEYPWVIKGPDPKDFFGNEFLVWLWHELETKGGIVPVPGGKGRAKDVTAMIDKHLQLDCVFSATGKDTLRGDQPTKMVEARDALKTGKVPRRCGLVVEYVGQQYLLSLGAETMMISSAKLPEIEEADHPRQVMEQRVALLGELSGAMDGLFSAFINVRFGGGWSTAVDHIRKWIAAGTSRNMPKIQVHVPKKVVEREEMTAE